MEQVSSESGVRTQSRTNDNQHRIHPLLRRFADEDVVFDVKKLNANSKHSCVRRSSDIQLLPIDPQNIQTGFRLRMPVYMRSASEVVITFAKSDGGDEGTVFQINLGAERNTSSWIGIDGAKKAESNESNILSMLKPIKVIFEIKDDGWVNVFTSHNPFKPLLSYFDVSLADVKYVSYWSRDHLDVWYDSNLSAEPIEPFKDFRSIDMAEHPLLTLQDYPVGMSESFFAKYFKVLQSNAANIEYHEFINLNEIDNIHPEEYVLRMPFYMRGKSTACLLLTTQLNPTDVEDSAYEIVIDNTRTVIRKGVNGAIVTEAFDLEVLSANSRKKFVIDITRDGDIKLYSEENLYRPIVHAFDTNPLSVEYMSLKTVSGDNVEMFYGNQWETYEADVKGLIKEKYGNVKCSPIRGFTQQIMDQLTLPMAQKHSQYYESWHPTYTKFNEMNRSHLRFIVQGGNEACILLSPTETPESLEANVYEIRIDQSRMSIRRTACMGQVYEQNLVSPHKLTMFYVELLKNGEINIWSSNNSYEPLLKVHDLKPVDVKYFSFASSGRMQFFHDLEIESLRSTQIFHTVSETTKSLHPKHPLVEYKDYWNGQSDLFFKHCTNEYVTLPETSDQYDHFIRLDDIAGIRPEGYVLQFPFYLRASKMAHVIFSAKENSTADDDAYELIVGSEDNSRVILRKRMNGAVMANVYWPNILSKFKRIKFVFQVCADGHIELFSQFDAYKPLLSVYDPIPIQMEFVSVKCSAAESLVFNYGDMENLSANADITEYAPSESLPLWSPNQIRYLDTMILFENAKYHKSWPDGKKKLLTIDDNKYKPDGYILRYPIYILGEGVIKFMLAAVDELNYDIDTYYEIEIGLNGCAWSRLLRNGVELSRSMEPELTSHLVPIKWIFEISNDGTMNIHCSQNQHAPLMTAHVTPIDIKYIWLDSESPIGFFYDMNDDNDNIKRPASDEYFGDPTFAVCEYSGLTDLYFEKYFETIVVDTKRPFEYTKWIQLNDVNGYHCYSEFYLSGANEAHIVVSNKASANADDEAIEIVINNWHRDHTIVRSRINGAVLEDRFTPNLLSKWRKSKLILIMRKSEIRLYCDNWPGHLCFRVSDQIIPENLKINYLSVKNVNGHPLTMSYGKPNAVELGTVWMDLAKERYGDLVVHSEFANQAQMKGVELKQLCLCGNTIESWGPFITKFIPIECNAQKTTIPVWIKADRDIRILFTRTECEDDGVLGIHIGGNDNTLINVHSLGADKEWSACEQDILRPTKIMKLVIEWLPNGLFSVYSSLNPYGPLIQIDDMPSLESIKFIAFSSASAALSYFVYDVDEQRVEKLVAEPKKKLLPIDAVVHPLLAQNNYPIGFSTLFFQEYCQCIETTIDGNETKTVNLSDYKGFRPDGYLIRFPFWLIDGYEIILSFSQDDNPVDGNAYEVISTCACVYGRRSLLRKRIKGVGSIECTPWGWIDYKPKKYVFEVTINGNVRLFCDDFPTVPMLETFDPQPFAINFLHYRTARKEATKMYFSDVPTDPTDVMREHLIQKYYGSAAVHPSLQNWNALAAKMTPQNLVKYGTCIETFRNQEYSNSIAITEQYRPTGYKLRFPLYIVGNNKPQILLSAVENPDIQNADFYAIEIGDCDMFPKSRISNSIYGIGATEVTEFNILQRDAAVKVIIEVTNDDVVNVYTSHNPYAPLVTTTLATKIDVNYISFASKNILWYFYDVNEDAIERLSPNQNEDAKVEPAKHLSFDDSNCTIELKDSNADERYATSENEYGKFINLIDIANDTPDNFIARIPFYIRSECTACVLFSSLENPTFRDVGYELTLDPKNVGFGKRSFSRYLSQCAWPDTISVDRFSKFVFEVTTDGHVRLYSEVYPQKPLVGFFDPNPVDVKFMSLRSMGQKTSEIVWRKVE